MFPHIDLAVKGRFSRGINKVWETSLRHGFPKKSAQDVILRQLLCREVVRVSVCVFSGAACIICSGGSSFEVCLASEGIMPPRDMSPVHNSLPVNTPHGML